MENSVTNNENEEVREGSRFGFFLCFILLFEYLLFCRESMISLVLGKQNDPGDS